LKKQYLHSTTIASPATTVEETVPAEYRTVQKTQVVKPETVSQNSIPSETRTYRTTQVVKPETVEQSTIPSQSAQYTVTTLAAPATTESVSVPSQTSSYTVTSVANPATTTTSSSDAQYTTVSKRQLVSKGGFSDWREVVCGEKITPALVSSVQRSLNDRGYNAGSADGVLGAGTRNALRKFQQDNGLPIGSLNIETLRALGVR